MRRSGGCDRRWNHPHHACRLSTTWTTYDVRAAAVNALVGWRVSRTDWSSSLKHQIRRIDITVEIEPSAILDGSPTNFEGEWRNPRERELYREVSRGRHMPARVDKRCRYVVCGMRDCGARLASLHRQAERDGPPGTISMLPGFAPTNGAKDMWALSAHARRRQSTGRSLKVRRIPECLGGFGGDVADNYWAALPISVRCPTCGMQNIVTAERTGARSVELFLARPQR